jgi:hypothetical protein
MKSEDRLVSFLTGSRVLEQLDLFVSRVQRHTNVAAPNSDRAWPIAQ